MDLQRLQSAFAEKNLTLYLGAGVSVPSGLPSWDRLVLMMYLEALGRLEHAANPLKDWRVFPNYLEAIAQWLLGSSIDPAEITAQKIRSMFQGDDADAQFVTLLKETLYAPIEHSQPRPNTTLEAVKKLACANGTTAIVTYNYDDLVERNAPQLEAVWELEPNPVSGSVPVYHVHGFLPPERDASTYAELVLTEEQFHSAASDPYSWSNLVQIKQLGSSVGLMVGMSLRDRNLRRILKAIQKLPDRCPQFAILKKEKRRLTDSDLEQIEENARRYGQHRKMRQKAPGQIRSIFQDLDEYDQGRTKHVLEGLGVSLIWIDDYDQIPDILDSIQS